ncbi:MAG TPA: thioesterase family protein [Candidatus Paceibacterota bacterium]|nr:thioesterase family protein [Verrucomicrobiota bacterium]HRY51953.1 thioesterase family protein [Candidatus Paceibacterota bacterium]HSA03570.1 thioesterase family protein [Candidatus Paceibacterota bacterium]
MRNTIKTGMCAEIEFRVENEHTISFLEADMPAVLSTPSLIWFLEHAAIEVLKPVLEAGEVSVGTNVEIQHLAPTPAGCTVTCRARVVQADGQAVSFHVEAHDSHELIARGYHQRRIVRAGSIAKRVLAKKL